MSYEYFAAVGPDIPIQLDQLFNSAHMRTRVEVLSNAPLGVSLRFLEAPRRTEWPEDIAVERNPDGLLISFHAGTASSREEFLLSMRMLILEVAHILVEFEES